MRSVEFTPKKTGTYYVYFSEDDIDIIHEDIIKCVEPIIRKQILEALGLIS